MKGCRHSLLISGMIAGLLFAAVSAPGEEIEESDVQAWVQYEYQFKLGEKWRGSWDLGYRELMSTEDVLGEWSRLHTRGTFSYVHSKWVAFDCGI